MSAPSLPEKQMFALDLLACELQTEHGPRAGFGPWRSLNSIAAGTRNALVRKGLAEQHPSSSEGFDPITAWQYRLTETGRAAVEQIPLGLRQQWQQAREDRRRRARQERGRYHPN